MSEVSNAAPQDNLLSLLDGLDKCQFARRILVISGTPALGSALTPALNKFNQPVEVVQVGDLVELTDAIKKTGFDVVLYVDGLNTHKDLTGPTHELAQLNFGRCIIRIDEGNQKGKGRKVSGGYQRNEKTAAYVRHIKQNFHKFDVTLRRDRNCIVIAKGRKYYELDDDGEA